MKTTDTTPRTYEDLLRLIEQRHDSMSKTYRKIAALLTHHPNEVGVQSVNALAAGCGIHASSFVRFAQSLGYAGFKDLQGLFQTRLAAMGAAVDASETALRRDLRGRDPASALGQVHRSIAEDIAALEAVLDGIDEGALEMAVGRIVAARTVYLIGQARAAPIVDLLRDHLMRMGKTCMVLDATSGQAVTLAQGITREDVLIAACLSTPSEEVSALVVETGKRGCPVIALADGGVSFADEDVDLFAFLPPARPGSGSLVAPLGFARALASAVAARMTGRTDPPCAGQGSGP